MRKTRSALLTAMVVTMLSQGLDARGQILQTPNANTGENIEGLTVSGKATVYARPNRMEIDLQVASSSELTADAIIKYRDAKRRVEEAFENLKLEEIEVQEGGLLVDQKGAVPNQYGGFDPRSNLGSRSEVQLSRKLVVRCSEIQEVDEEELLQLVARLLDVAQDSGGTIGVPPGTNPYQYNPRGTPINLVRFIVDDFDDVQEQAYEAAVADAKVRAERLARLSGAKLGPIVAIREVSVPGDPLPNVTRVIVPNEDPPREDRLESARLQEVPVRVELLVRFQIRPSDVEGAETP